MDWMQKIQNQFVRDDQCRLRELHFTPLRSLADPPSSVSQITFVVVSSAHTTVIMPLSSETLCNLAHFLGHSKAQF